MAIRDIKAGEELFVEYGYPFSGSPRWYKELVLSHMRKDPNFFNSMTHIIDSKTLNELEKEFEKTLEKPDC